MVHMTPMDTFISLGHGQLCQVSAVRLRTPLKCPRQWQTLHRVGAVTTMAFLQVLFCPQEKPRVRQQPHSAFSSPGSGNLCSAFYFPSYLDAGYYLGPLGLASCTWCVCKGSGPCIKSLLLLMAN